MKKTIAKDMHVCDACEAEDIHPKTCLRCGDEHCYACSQTQGVTFNHAVHFSGSGDGYYCAECAAIALRESDPIRLAYQAIEDLRTEAKEWGEGFRTRQDEAEEHLKAVTGN